jgi:transcription initiation factor TFIIIB Brf1 subunit/transcription initiation factor TFIIB
MNGTTKNSCPNCGEEISEEDIVCPSCGTLIAEPAYDALADDEDE